MYINLPAQGRSTPDLYITQSPKTDAAAKVIPEWPQRRSLTTNITHGFSIHTMFCYLYKMSFKFFIYFIRHKVIDTIY